MSNACSASPIVPNASTAKPLLRRAAAVSSRSRSVSSTSKTRMCVPSSGAVNLTVIADRRCPDGRQEGQQLRRYQGWCLAVASFQPAPRHAANGRPATVLTNDHQRTMRRQRSPWRRDRKADAAGYGKVINDKAPGILADRALASSRRGGWPPSGLQNRLRLRLRAPRERLRSRASRS